MPSGYDPVSLQHPEMERLSMRQTQSADTGQSSTQYDHSDAKSYQSHVPINKPQANDPPLPTGASKHPRTLDEAMSRTHSEAERGHDGMPSEGQPLSMSHRNSSWDLLGGIKKFEHNYAEFDSRNASEAHLAFADGDVPKNKLSRLYNYLLNVSIVSRWILFIVPMLAIIWIPGILQLTKFPHAQVWGVRLLWWSIWLSVVWGGWWAALAFSRVAPIFFRGTIGVMAVGLRRYIDWFAALGRYVAFFGWSIAIWVAFTPLIFSRQQDSSASSSKIISLILKLLFSIFLSAAILLGEKFAIQYIAAKFHETSYAERIADQKFAVKVLVTLYRNSSDMGRSDTLAAAHATHTRDATHVFRSVLRGARKAAATTTTIFGNVASEIAGSSVLQPNSPAAMIQTALSSANKSQLLARRIFYSFAKQGAPHIVPQDIARYFPSAESAEAAYAIFDKDANGDITRDELEMCCMELHREQLSIEHSLSDMDSAVARLDDLFMSVYFLVCILIFAVALEAQLVTLITGAGTFILGLSWLIGGTLQEVLTSTIFLFIKHPFDVGDRVNILTAFYTVKEIRLLSTVFLDSQGCLVQAPNIVLNTTYIQNIRRSGQMSEPFPFEVDYGTTFEQLEALREKMMIFLKEERRDYLPIFDVMVVDLPDQTKMVLAVDIKYKSNWQQGALKSKRRNKWVCALKVAMSAVNIYGPSGNPKAVAAPSKYTLVPWDEVQAADKKAAEAAAASADSNTEVMPEGGWNLSDKRAVIVEENGDVFDEASELNLTNPRRGLIPSGMRQRPAAGAPDTSASGRPLYALPSSAIASEAIEMTAVSNPTA